MTLTWCNNKQRNFSSNIWEREISFVIPIVIYCVSGPTQIGSISLLSAQVWGRGCGTKVFRYYFRLPECMGMVTTLFSYICCQYSGLILGLRPANGRRCYFVTLFPVSITRQNKIQITRIITFFWYCDLDIWPITLKSTGHTIANNVCANFEIHWSSAFWIIAFTSYMPNAIEKETRKNSIINFWILTRVSNNPPRRNPNSIFMDLTSNMVKRENHIITQTSLFPRLCGLRPMSLKSLLARGIVTTNICRIWEQSNKCPFI